MMGGLKNHGSMNSYSMITGTIFALQYNHGWHVEVIFSLIKVKVLVSD